MGKSGFICDVHHLTPEAGALEVLRDLQEEQEISLGGFLCKIRTMALNCMWKSGLRWGK